MKYWTIFTFFTLIFCLCSQTVRAQRRVNSVRKAEQDILNSILNEDYDSRINPGGNDTASGPTAVSVNVYLRNIDYVDALKQEMKVQMTFRSQWTDNRLSYTVPRQNQDLKFLTVHDTSKIWKPDLFISNDKESNVHDFSEPNQFIRIFPNGDILRSQRVTAALYCPMKFRRFPLDTQVCTIRIASFSQTTKDVLLTWKATDPVQIPPTLSLPHLTLTEFSTETCDAQTNTGVYGCLRINLSLKRVFSYYLVQVYIPTTMLVIMAWLALWLDPQALISRMVLSVASVGIMAINLARLNEQFPQVSYTKGIDWWNGTVMTFAFFVLCETVLVNYWSRAECGGGGGGCKKDEEKGNANGGEETKEEEVKLMEGATDEKAAEDVEEGKEKPKTKAGKASSAVGGLKCRFDKCWASQESCSQKVDFVSRIVYPILYLLYIILYFGVYCISA